MYVDICIRIYKGVWEYIRVYVYVCMFVYDIHCMWVCVGACVCVCISAKISRIKSSHFRIVDYAMTIMNCNCF